MTARYPKRTQRRPPTRYEDAQLGPQNAHSKVTKATSPTKNRDTRTGRPTTRGARGADHTAETAEDNMAISESESEDEASPGPGESWGPRQDEEDPLAQVKDVMGNIYVEIDAYQRTERLLANVTTGAQIVAHNLVKGEIRRTLRRARNLAFWRTMPKREVAALNTYPPSNADLTAIVNDVKQDLAIDREIAARYESFYTKPNLFIFTVCAHSETFREALARKDSQSQATGNTLWRPLYKMICANAASLELFAIVRDLDWDGALSFYQRDFNRLLTTVVPSRYHPKKRTLYGCSDQSVTRVHDIGDNTRQHNWVLQRRRTAALRPQTVITMTQPIVDKFTGTNISPVTDTEMDIIQEDIDDYEVWRHLPGWPTQLQTPQGATNGPDPRYCGRPVEPCKVCGRSCTMTQYRNRVRSCRCDLNGLQAAHGGQNTLVELVKTENFGTGVRTLRAIAEGEILGEYIGEVYPSVHSSQPNHRLYGNGYYVFDLPVYARDSDKPEDGIPNLDVVLDAVNRGNWTRYVNHHCSSNCVFENWNIGQLATVVVKANRDIPFGQQLSIGYGAEYWANVDFPCKCCHSTCRSWSNRLGERKLGDAKTRGLAPEWAMEDDNIPYDKPIAKHTLTPRALSTYLNRQARAKERSERAAKNA